MIERALAVDLAQSHLRLAFIHPGNKTPTLAARLQFFPALFEFGIDLRNLLPEILDRPFEIFLRNEQMLLDIALLYPISSLPSENNQLTDHIRSAQIDPGIGFCISGLLRHLDRLAHRHISTHLIENEVQRTGNHSLDPNDPVAAVDQIADRIDDRQSSPYVRFEQIFHATLAGNRFEFVVTIILRRCGYFIGRNHRYVVLQQILIDSGNIRTRRTIHKNRIENVHRQNSIAEFFG